MAQAGKWDSEILIVDDDPDIREALKDAFELCGFAATSAENGKHALELLSTLRPRVIFLDLMMPILDGLGFLAARRQSETLSRIPVVVLSAYGNLAAAATEVEGFIKKPPNLDALLAVARRYCVRPEAMTT